MRLFTTRTMAPALCLALTLAAGLGAPLAHAQDHGERMANIAAEHAQQMNDYSREAAENYANSQNDYYAEEEDTGYYGAYRPSSDPALNVLTLEMQYMMQAVERAQTIRAEMESDPRYERWLNGGWDHYRSRQPAGPGEYCAATYLSQDGLITLTGVDSSWDGAMLMFVGTKIPTPAELERVTATLSQTGASPFTVQAFLFAADPAREGFGTVVFSVPSMEDALRTMLDENDFTVEIDGREVFRMGYKEGLKARDELRKCVRQR